MSTEPAAGLRARTKARRRSAIIDAARQLWRRYGHDTVTMEQIAAAAEVSPATVYNLVGSREQLMAAVIDAVVLQVEAGLEGARVTGLARASSVIERAVALFVADPLTYKPITLRIPGTLLRHLAERDSARLQIEAIEQATRAGALVPTTPAAAVGRQIFFSFMGCVYAWACEDIDDVAFSSHSLLALQATILPFASDGLVPRVRREARRLAANLRSG